LLSLAIVAGASTANAGSSGAKLLDDTIRNPGGWNQMCSMPPPLPFNVPLPLYSLAVSRFYYLSSQDISRLRAQRGEVVPVIVKRLHDLDLSKKAQESSRHDPEGLSGTLLQIVMELNAVETLPELLRVEADLNQRIEKAGKDVNASLPDLDLDSP